MNGKKSERYRGISIAALVISIAAIIMNIPASIKMIPAVGNSALGQTFQAAIFDILNYAGTALSVVAISMAGVDLRQIRDGRSSSKGRGLDQTAIAIGILHILPFIILELL